MIISKYYEVEDNDCGTYSYKYSNAHIKLKLKKIYANIWNRNNCLT